MTKLAIIGGTGYAGSNIAKAAAEQGLTVTAYARKAPESPIAGVEYREGSALDPKVAEQAAADADVVVVAISPRGDMAGKVGEAVETIAHAVAAAGKRLGVIGGAGSLKVSEDGPKLVDTPDFPQDYKAEALEMNQVLENLQADDSKLDWFFVSPAASFGGYHPGEATGKYRVGEDVLLSDENGESFISGADLADAVVKEIEHPKHHGVQFTVAY